MNHNKIDGKTNMIYETWRTDDMLVDQREAAMVSGKLTNNKTICEEQWIENVLRTLRHRQQAIVYGKLIGINKQMNSIFA